MTIYTALRNTNGTQVILTDADLDGVSLHDREVLYSDITARTAEQAAAIFWIPEDSHDLSPSDLRQFPVR
jgi:hypothetical protein